MMMPPRLRRLALLVHVACSVALLGAVAGFLALSVAGLGGDQTMSQAAYPAMNLVVLNVIVPLTFAGVVTGLVQALGTKWGLFRHYWVLAKLVVMIFVTIVLLLQLENIAHLAQAAAEGTIADANFAGARLSPVLHSASGLLILLIPVALSLYKPRGLTRYGWLKQHARG